MNNDDAEKFWQEMRRKNAHLIGESTFESREKTRQEDENSFFNRNFPTRTSIEEAYLEEDQSILVVVTTNEIDEGCDTSTASNRRIPVNDEEYQTMFGRHRFASGKEKHHWIVWKFDEILGEGWGSEL